ncbi:MAG: hypothetical protein K6E74_02590 [Bacilli bacterium]|nr:hypothetical protein [Bacilli bacterium]
MDFTSLFNNQKTVVRLLKNSFDNDRLFHTYLFSGPRGSLKMDAAIYLASLILCDNGGACGSCEECVNIDKWSNEHLFIVSPDGDSIKKEQIEALEHEFGYKSDHTRVFIIQQIDKATLTAANTLLKFLEDLPSNCFGIILTENINKVLPTIKSRSQIVNFLPISSDVVRDELIQKGIELERAHIISKITNNLSIASRYTKSKNLDKAIDLVKHISEEIEQRNNPYLVFMNEGQFLYTLDRDKARIFFDLMVIIQDDKVNYLINRKDKMTFKSLEYTNICLLKEEEIEILEIILKFRERMDTNANIDMIYTQMFVEIERAIK